MVGPRAMSSPTTRSPRTIPPVPLRVMMLGLLVAVLGVGCPCIRNTINDSPSIRWWLFSNFGASKMCPEMLKRGAPLKLSPDGNVVGRFFPTQCTHDVNESAQTITLHFGGTGFAWTPVAGRIGFAMNASIEYRPDFWLGEDSMYIWAKTNRVVAGPDFKVGSVENKFIDMANRTPVGYLVNTFGNQIVGSKLSQGFTVVRTDDEGDLFTLGILQPPALPKRPFNTSKGDKYVFANETSEVRLNQIDFVGPIEVADDDQSLFLRMRLQGPAVDVLIVRRGSGDLWRDGLQRGMALGPPPNPPVTGFALNPGAQLAQKVKLQRGQYYVVVDNSARVGRINPPFNLLGAVGGGTATVSTIVEVGEDDDTF